MSLTFPLTATDTPSTPDTIAAVHADPGFGVHFTDHMAVATWRQGSGWAGDAVVPYGPFQLDPSTAVLHYAQEVFESPRRRACGLAKLQNGSMSRAR